MLTRVFTKNKSDKIEFTEKELKELLDEIYEYGYKEGKGEKTYTYTSPSWWTLQKPFYTYTTTPGVLPKYEVTCATSTDTTTNTKGENK